MASIPQNKRDSFLSPKPTEALRYLLTRTASPCVRHLLITGEGLRRAASVYARNENFISALEEAASKRRLIHAVRIKYDAEGGFLGAMFLGQPKVNLGWTPREGNGPDWYVPNMATDEGRKIAQRLELSTEAKEFGLSRAVLRSILLDYSILDGLKDPSTGETLHTDWYLSHNFNEMVVRFETHAFHPASLSAYREAFRKKPMMFARSEVMRAIGIQDILELNGFKYGFREGELNVEEIPMWHADALYYHNEEKMSAKAMKQAIADKAFASRLPGEIVEDN